MYAVCRFLSYHLHKQGAYLKQQCSMISVCVCMLTKYFQINGERHYLRMMSLARAVHEVI